MRKISDRAWSILFALSVGVLMLAVLLIRTDPAPVWVLVVYPAVGAALALAASRTSPSAEQMAWIESGAIAAATIVTLAGLLNLLLVEMLLREWRAGEMLDGGPARRMIFFAAPAVAALLWWGLQRRLSRLRVSGTVRRRRIRAVIPAE